MKRQLAIGGFLLAFAVTAVVYVYAEVLRPVVAFQVPPVVAGLPQQSNFAVLVIQIVGFLTLLVTYAFQFVKDTRQRKYDLEDRAAARADAITRAEMLRLAQIETAIELAKVSKINKDKLLSAIVANTALTADHAVTASAKLEELQQALIGKKGCNVAVTLADIAATLEETKGVVETTKRTVDEAKTVSTDTNVKVTDLVKPPADDAKTEGAE